MKKILFTPFICFFLLNTQVCAQVKFVHFYAGYALKTSTQNLETLFDQTSKTSSSRIERVNLSLGNGFSAGASFGYMFNKNLGASVEASYLLGGTTSSLAKSNSGYAMEYRLSSQMLRVVPSLIIAAGFEKLDPYARFGMVVGVGSINTGQKYTNNNGETFESAYRFNGGIALGIHAGIGIAYKRNDKTQLFAELNSINMSYAPSKGKMTKALNNGQDELGTYSTSQKETRFVNSYDYPHGNPPSPDEPAKRLKESLAFGSIGINIGVRFLF